ncbi:MAG: sodium/hydrogen exchanger [Capsulimonas sp.]|jgi:CPA2 family monovalent cation:H+ antiporter-2|nr:sodium/hydrogen exchanger [Capsulimonas sp.]
MHQAGFLLNIGIALLAALAGGLIARWVKLPVLIGYLVAGVVVGPHTPGILASPDTIHTVANLGVVLLMFTVGIHFSLDELNAVRRTALVGGGVILLGMVLLGLLIGAVFHWGVYGGLFLGCALFLSSTAVMMRIMDERGELGTSHGAIMLGILVVQDLSLVLMAALLPALAGVASHGAAALIPLVWALLKAALFMGVAIVLAIKGVPALMGRVSRMGSQELFLLTGVGICLVTAVTAELAGLGLALGAFIAGIVVSETDYAHELFAQIRPLRDVFAAVFFVSVGMLLDPVFLREHWPAVLCVVLAIVIGKALLSALAVYATGHHGRTAIMAGLGLAQIGEFSFVLANIGSERKLINPEITGVILSAALITLLLTPFVYGAAGPLYARLNRNPKMSRWLNRHAESEAVDTDACSLARVLVLGYGRVGRYVSDALRANEIPHIVVDYDGTAIAQLKQSGVIAIYGDASSETVLKQTQPHCLALAIVALPEASTTEMAIHTLKHLAPKLPVVARVHRGIDIPRMREAGADDVIHAEFEAGTEMIRQSLSRLELSDSTVQEYIDGVRQHRYRREAEPAA